MNCDQSSGVRLRRAEEVLRGIFKISSEAIIVTDRRTNILMFNAGAEVIFGYSAEEIVGQSIERLMPTRFRSLHGQHVERFDRGSADSMLMRERGQILGLRKTGEEFPIEASLSKLETPDGTIFTIIIRDISERRFAEERIARSEQRLKTALQNADLHVFDLDYRRQTLSKGGVEDTFYDRPMTYDDLAGNIWCGVRPDHRQSVEEAWRRHIETGEPYRAEFPVNRTDGKEVWVLSTAELTEDEQGRPLRLIGALQDITERRRAEAAMTEAAAAAEAANVAKSAFLATMSHEIRTPLNGVLGMAQVMALDELSPLQRDRLDVVRQSGKALLAILNDVLDLAKIEAGRLDLEAIEFDFGGLVGGAQAAFTALANKHGLSFAIDIEAAQGVYVGDPTRIRQILYNLISNALKFCEVGEIRVTATHEDGVLRLAVADTGIGMAPDVLASLFKSFVQADASTTRRYGGTGLGLSICRQLAELMGGSITATSAVDQGSTFTLDLPLQRIGDAQAVARVAEEFGAARAAKREIRVLAAEDNPTNQLVLKTLLHQIGVEPTLVDNGRMAVEAWEAGEFDVILMDVQMPELDGPAAARLIRSKEAAAGLSAIPIIALTANAMAHQIEAYLEAGMDMAVTKPIDVAKLFAALDAVLEGV